MPASLPTVLVLSLLLFVGCGDDASSSAPANPVGDIDPGGDATNDVPQEADIDVVSDASQEVAQDIASEVLLVDSVEEVTSDVALEVTDDASLIDAAADAAADITADTAVDVAPDLQADTTDTASDTVADAEADAVPDSAPDVLADAVIDAMEDAPSDVESEISEDACITGAGQCIGNQFCLAAGCGTGLDGVCSFEPANCEDELVGGVCGCDGTTYLNTCVAHQSGVNVAGSGACPESPVVCTVAKGFGQGEGCALGEYCMGGCEGAGICMEKANGCDDLTTGVVCGCNNNTYATACLAASAGVNVQHDGPCPGSEQGPPQACGGEIEEPCPEGKHCDISGCDPEKTGICQAIWLGPDVPGLLCLPGEPQECGCDGVTYLNKCQRILAGAAKAQLGACGDTGCELGVPDDCGVGLYCGGPTGSCSGEGSCLQKSLICLTSSPAVCGCDGETYTSPCHANKQDVPIASLGACP